MLLKRDGTTRRAPCPGETATEAVIRTAPPRPSWAQPRRRHHHRRAVASPKKKQSDVAGESDARIAAARSEGDVA